MAGRVLTARPPAIAAGLWRRITRAPRRLRSAIVIAFFFNSALILLARYRLSYDAYVHMFFSDHYRQSWWNPWEPRWYGGFSVVSYPPLAHQLGGLLSHLVGVEAAFAVSLLLVLTALPAAVFAFARLFTGPIASGYAALLAAVLPSIYLAAHTFGQLPTLTGLLFALLGLAALGRYLRNGWWLDGALSAVLMGVTASAHHGTLLFLPWGVAAVVLQAYLTGQASARCLLRRLLPWGLASGAAILLVIWPFWQWGMGESMQTPIDHLSRHSFLGDPKASLLFFWPVYGPLLLLLPWAIRMCRQRKRLALGVMFFPLFLLGLGGTTPLPRWLYGENWAWLTYDRFALWASVALLPYAGLALLTLARKKHPLRARLLSSSHLLPVIRLKRNARAGARLPAILHRPYPSLFVLSLALLAGFNALLPAFFPFQPEAVDMQPIVNFLAKEDHSRWRYLTFGFGDQLARLSILTEARTIDGSYHTARQLPELRSSGIGQIDAAYWNAPGLDALDPILAVAGERGVRWAFVDLVDYAPRLARHGWVRLGELRADGTIRNGSSELTSIRVWENPAAALPAQEDPAEHFNFPWALSWGSLPLLFLALAGCLAWLRSDRSLTPARLAGRSMRALYRVAIAALPLTIGFWYFFPLVALHHPRVYLTYTSGLIYLSDAVAILAVGAWAIERLLRFLDRHAQPEDAPARPGRDARMRVGEQPGLRMHTPSIATLLLFALALLATTSLLWSAQRQVSAFVALHLWLMFALYLSLGDDPGAWRWAAWGCALALLVQSGLCIAEVLSQSTGFLGALGLKWPGALTPGLSGASVVQLLDGTRLLRAYGSLPHPNLAGGLIVGCLAGPAALFLAFEKRSSWSLPVVLLGSIALTLTFSRSAWIGLVISGAVLFLRRAWLGQGNTVVSGDTIVSGETAIRGKAVRKRLSLLAGLVLAGALATALLVWQPVATRLSNAPVSTEQRSTRQRLSQLQQSLGLIRSRPWLGVGIGVYPFYQANALPGEFEIEPVHNLPLLATAELGLAGGLILLALAGVVLASLKNTYGVVPVVFSGALLGLLTIGLLDHYLWSLAPGRALLWLFLGLWQWSQPVNRIE